jgi:uncharacterized membrane protein
MSMDRADEDDEVAVAAVAVDVVTLTEVMDRRRSRWMSRLQRGDLRRWGAQNFSAPFGEAAPFLC